MPKKCVVCKKLQNPSNSRSFHRFPVNEEQRNKWLRILGLSSIKSYSTICSDHFEKHFFHHYGVYPTKKRLFPNAVPKCTLGCSSLENSDSNAHSDNETDYNQLFTDVEVLESDIDDINDNDQCTNDLSDSVADFGCNISDTKIEENAASNNGENSVNINNTVAINGDEKKIFVRTRRKMSFTIGSKVECLSRYDFVSDESWNVFLKLNKHYKQIMRSAYRKIARSQETIEGLKILNENLKDYQKKIYGHCGR